MLLRGAGSVVAQAVDVIDVLDQPLLRGRYGAIIEPASLKVEELAEALRRVLTTEGYGATTNLDAGGGAVVLLPMASINKLVVFAWDQPTLDHVEQWAELLVDQQRDTVAEGIFSYQVRNAQAEPIAEALGRVLDEGQLIVAKNRNTLLFRGAGDQWGRLLPVLREMDAPVPSVLIEVLIAEVTISDETQSGIDFLFNSAVRRFGLRAAHARVLQAATLAWRLVPCRWCWIAPADSRHVERFLPGQQGRDPLSAAARGERAATRRNWKWATRFLPSARWRQATRT